MSEYKGKPSGKVAPNKKSPGRQGDLKADRPAAGARKKSLSKAAGVRGVAGSAGSNK